MVDTKVNPVLLVTAPFAVHNLHGPDKNANRRHASILALLNAAKGGIGAFNELNSKDRAYIKAEAAKRGLNVRISDKNGMVYDPTKFWVGAPRIKKIMQGGHVGADGVHTAKPGDDDRRVGPNRYAMYFPVKVLAIGLQFEFVVTHLMARAFTAHKWRQKLFWRSVRELADGVIDADGIVTGDFNTNPPVNLPGVADVNVSVEADMGPQHYTKVMRWGKHIFISAMKDQNTPSDHDLLKGRVTFYREPQGHLVGAPESPTPTPKPKLPKPGARGVRWRKYGAPVAHPWRKRYTTRKFEKRRPVMAKRIARWKTAYRRRL